MYLSGARGRTRTGTALRPRDFKSPMSTIPPRGHSLNVDYFEAPSLVFDRNTSTKRLPTAHQRLL